MFQGVWDFGSKVQECSKESGTSVLKFRDVPRNTKESGTSVLKFRDVPRSLGLRF